MRARIGWISRRSIHFGINHHCGYGSNTARVEDFLSGYLMDISTYAQSAEALSPLSVSLVSNVFLGRKNYQSPQQSFSQLFTRARE